MSKVEVLVATMNQGDFSLFKKMNIQTDAVIANQADEFSFKQELINNCNVKLVTTSSRGVGRNRNNALLNASGEILLMADDDIVYIDGYEKVILDTYKQYPKADMVLFNFHEERGDEKGEIIKRSGKIKRRELLRYGTVCYSIKKDFWLSKNVFFSLLYGGGAKYSCGEDVLFLYELYKKDARIYKTNKIIGSIKNENSTWFKAYDDSKYLYDKGFLFYNVAPKLGVFLVIYHVIRSKNKYKNIGMRKAFSFIMQGYKDHKDQFKKT